MLVNDYTSIIDPHVNHKNDNDSTPLYRTVDEQLIARVGAIFIAVLGIFTVLFELTAWSATEGSVGLLTLDPKYTGKIVGSSVVDAAIMTVALVILGLLTFIHPKTGVESSYKVESVRNRYHLFVPKKNEGFNRFNARPATVLRLGYFVAQILASLFQDLGKDALQGQFKAGEVKECFLAAGLAECRSFPA